MKGRARLIVLTVWASTLAGGPISAGIVYEQDQQYPSMQSAWSSSFDPLTGATKYGSLYTTFDNFSLARAATVTDLTWEGFSFNANTLGSTILPVQGFTVTFYSDSGGVPGALLLSQTIGFTQQAAGTIDNFGDGQTEIVENYSGTLTTGFAAAAGTNYWISIQAVTPYPALWMWASGTGGDGTSYQVASAREGGGSFVRPSDRTFTLLASIPEPSSLVLCAVATLIGAGVGVARLRIVAESPG